MTGSDRTFPGASNARSASTMMSGSNPGSPGRTTISCARDTAATAVEPVPLQHLPRARRIRRDRQRERVVLRDRDERRAPHPGDAVAHQQHPGTGSVHDDAVGRSASPMQSGTVGMSFCAVCQLRSVVGSSTGILATGTETFAMFAVALGVSSICRHDHEPGHDADGQRVGDHRTAECDRATPTARIGCLQDPEADRREHGRADAGDEEHPERADVMVQQPRSRRSASATSTWRTRSGPGTRSARPTARGRRRPTRRAFQRDDQHDRSRTTTDDTPGDGRHVDDRRAQHARCATSAIGRGDAREAARIGSPRSNSWGVSASRAPASS